MDLRFYLLVGLFLLTTASDSCSDLLSRCCKGTAAAIIRNSIFPAGELVFTVEELVSPVGELAFPTEELIFPVQELSFPVEKSYFQNGIFDFLEGKMVSPNGKFGFRGQKIAFFDVFRRFLRKKACWTGAEGS